MAAQNLSSLSPAIAGLVALQSHSSLSPAIERRVALQSHSSLSPGGGEGEGEGAKFKAVVTSDRCPLSQETESFHMKIKSETRFRYTTCKVGIIPPKF